ncbi:MAG: hypothetical protein FRX48_03079 [Lasallia pustulata]|uniref:Uncharacterized protein n=1 Tax=Lasallia pustulata TaxID=136370 RepID=A0A5M8PXC7_9LECA|nr:MAG: hypothetical protein FRX48_03079 [Lasallia pustulata]
MQKGSTLPELCAKLDRGGGVCCGDVFVVFTTFMIPAAWSNDVEFRDRFSRAQIAASSLASVLPFFLCMQDLKREGLASLPYGISKVRKSLSQEPWFFLNASAKEPHHIGIAGTGSATETLLAVLARPWCVLELCCSRLDVVEALAAFADIALEFDSKIYMAARLLLCHEKDTRTHKSRRSSWISSWVSQQETAVRRRETLSNIRSLCTALFIVSENSYNGFWLRVICVCALWLAMPISLAGQCLETVDQNHLLPGFGMPWDLFPQDLQGDKVRGAHFQANDKQTSRATRAGFSSGVTQVTPDGLAVRVPERHRGLSPFRANDLGHGHLFIPMYKKIMNLLMIWMT